jgi:DNA-binding CsgD family transcriptional regulator
VALPPQDAIGIVEALYLSELSADRWLRIVAERLRPVLDRYGLGIAAGLHSSPDPCSFHPTHALLCDVPGPLADAFFRSVSAGFSPVYVADSFLSRACYLSSDVREWKTVPGVVNGEFAAAGSADFFQINVIEPDGDGCWFCSPQAELRPIEADTYLLLTRVARHMSAAHRLFRKHQGASLSPDHAEAVLDPDGRVRHATGPAQDSGNQGALARAAHSMDLARSRFDGADSRRAIEQWPSLIAKRWTLLEHFESDGKRFILAMENRRKPPSFDLLTARERDVILRALAGRGNKAIAHELGLAQSTVRVLLGRAAIKLRAHSRKELLEKAAGLGALARP